MTYSTYADLIANVSFEVNNPELVSQMTDEQFIIWINQAEKKVCELTRVEGEFSIDLIQNQIDYQLTTAPSEMKDVIYIRRIWGNFKREVKMVSLQELLRMERDDSIAIRVYTDYDSPRVCALWTDPNGDSYLKFYPDPKSNQIATVYYLKEIDPVLHVGDATTVQIQTPSRFNIAVQHYVKYLFFTWAGNIKRAQVSMAEFDREMKELKQSKVNHSRTQIVYT